MFKRQRFSPLDNWQSLSEKRWRRDFTPCTGRLGISMYPKGILWRMCLFGWVFPPLYYRKSKAHINSPSSSNSNYLLLLPSAMSPLQRVGWGIEGAGQYRDVWLSSNCPSMRPTGCPNVSLCVMAVSKFQAVTAVMWGESPMELGEGDTQITEKWTPMGICQQLLIKPPLFPKTLEKWTLMGRGWC